MSTAPSARTASAFERAEVDLFGGHSSAHGEVVWGGAGSWDISGRATGINPGLLRADLPGSLNFSYTSTGSGFGMPGKLAMSASFSDLTGKLRGASASGGGTIAHTGTTLEFTNVRVSLGGTSLALDGQVNERLNLRFALNTQDLSLLDADSRGQLKASGTVAGTLANPAVVAIAHGHDIDYQGLKIAAFEANINFDPAAIDRESHVEFAVHKLNYKTRTLDAAAFTLQGPPSAYTVHLTASCTGPCRRYPGARGVCSTELQGTADRTHPERQRRAAPGAGAPGGSAGLPGARAG